MPGRYLTEYERYQIEILLKDKKTQTEIAELLKRNKSTISREIRRGLVTLRDGKTWENYTVYKADVAQRRYDEAKKNKAPDLKIGNDMDFVRFVEYWIKEMKYSPQAVLYKIQQENLSFKTNICRQTLYRYIYNGVFLNLTQKDLPYKKQHKKPEQKNRIALKNLKGKPITKRPEEAESREIYGHWEIDTVVPGTNKGRACLLVLSERMTREEIIIKIPDKKSSSVIKALDRIEKKTGTRAFREKFKSITCDNGTEFLDHQQMEQSYRNKRLRRTAVYYCHPYSAWERGTNENQNRLIRRWTPKGASIEELTEKNIVFIQEWVNSYPRKIFNGRSSNAMQIRQC